MPQTACQPRWRFVSFYEPDFSYLRAFLLPESLRHETPGLTETSLALAYSLSLPGERFPFVGLRVYPQPVQAAPAKQYAMEAD
ncbi:hypothetical protein, partial [Enterobacter ludwigii]|uniref:hypothetical protein n=1 Tax=Enterobacter ludwigii TaxID=299767 RepID=UPI001E2D4E07